MAVYRNKKEDNFTVLDNKTLQDDNLSWKARGILVYLLSLPPDWEVKTSEIKRHASDGITSLRSGIKELKEAGYVVYRKYKNDEGKFVHEYEVYETPQSENPDLENPSVENPNVGKGDINKEHIEQRTNKQSNNNMSSKEDDDIKEVWRQYKSIFTDYYKPRSFSQKRKGKIRQRLQSYSVEELVNAMKAIAANDYMIGKNDNGKFYAKPEYCFRNDEKVEEWLNDYESSESSFDENIDYYADLD